MTGWDILSGIMDSFPPIAATAVLVAAAIVFIVGFARHGHAFLRYGFKQVAVVSSLEKRFDDMESRFAEVKADIKAEIDGLRTEIKTDIKAEIDGLRTEIKADIKAEIDGFRTEIKADIKAEIDGLRTEVKSDIKAEIDGLRTEVKTELSGIKTNHFGHLKGFLTELTSILLDKEILSNTDKARLDNQLLGM